MHAELDAGPNQTWCRFGSVLESDFGEILTSLMDSYPSLLASKIKSQVKVAGSDGNFTDISPGTVPDNNGISAKSVDACEEF